MPKTKDDDGGGEKTRGEQKIEKMMGVSQNHRVTCAKPLPLSLFMEDEEEEDLISGLQANLKIAEEEQENLEQKQQQPCTHEQEQRYRHPSPPHQSPLGGYVASLRHLAEMQLARNEASMKYDRVQLPTRRRGRPPHFRHHHRRFRHATLPIFQRGSHPFCNSS